MLSNGGICIISSDVSIESMVIMGLFGLFIVVFFIMLDKKYVKQTEERAKLKYSDFEYTVDSGEFTYYTENEINR